MAVTISNLVYVPIPGSWLRLASAVADHRAPAIFADPFRRGDRSYDQVHGDCQDGTLVELAASKACSEAAFNDCLARLGDTTRSHDEGGADFKHLGLTVDAKLAERLRIKTPEEALLGGFHFLKPTCRIVPTNVYVQGLLLSRGEGPVACLVGCCRGSRFLSGPAPTWSELTSIADLRADRV